MKESFVLYFAQKEVMIKKEGWNGCCTEAL